MSNQDFALFKKEAREFFKFKNESAFNGLTLMYINSEFNDIENHQAIMILELASRELNKNPLDISE